MTIEEYSEDQPIGEMTQRDFDVALSNAIYRMAHVERHSRLTICASVLYLLFLIWGVLLAMRAPHHSRAIHIVLAIVFAPVYVIAYYMTGN